MEEKVFPTAAVAAELDRMIEARLHNDGEIQDEVEKLQLELADSYATPIYVVLDPDTDETLGIHAGPEFDEDLFADWLRQF